MRSRVASLASIGLIASAVLSVGGVQLVNASSQRYTVHFLSTPRGTAGYSYAINSNGDVLAALDSKGDQYGKTVCVWTAGANRTYRKRVCHSGFIPSGLSDAGVVLNQNKVLVPTTKGYRQVSLPTPDLNGTTVAFGNAISQTGVVGGDVVYSPPNSKASDPEQFYAALWYPKANGSYNRPTLLATSSPNVSGIVKAVWQTSATAPLIAAGEQGGLTVRDQAQLRPG